MGRTTRELSGGDRAAADASATWNRACSLRPSTSIADNRYSYLQGYNTVQYTVVYLRGHIPYLAKGLTHSCRLPFEGYNLPHGILYLLQWSSGVVSSLWR